MTGYQPAEVLAAISANAVPVVLIGGLSIVAMLVFFAEAARMGARDRVYPMALWMTALWWPHDGSYLLHLRDWFGRYDHWFMQLFWFAIVLTFLAESTFFVQTVAFGRQELSPGLSQPVHTARMLGVLACGVVSWVLLKGVMDDPLYLLSFMATLLWGGPSGSALLGRRPDGRGQSVTEWIGFTTMAVLYSITSIGFFGGGFFHSWAYVGLCLGACLWGLVQLRQVQLAGCPVSSFSARRELVAAPS
ncbi:MAG TPA: hypothetical protein VGH89_08155 [Pseudonocardia sp.]